MSSAKEGILRAAYTELAKAERSGDWERGLKAANRILKQFPQEVAAFQCRIVCFIQLSKFEEVLTLLRKAVPSLSKKCLFEKAYSEYRLNRTEEAIKTLKSQGEILDFRSQELLAQLLYRQEKFAECQQIYRQLLKESQDDYDQERQANLLAVEAQMIEENPESIEISTSGETYEQFYNQACALIAENQYRKALKNLVKAETLCREALMEEGATEDEIEEELSLMKAQRAFCHQMMGDVDKAFDMYAEILKQKPSDQVLLAVTSNNTVSIRKTEQQLNLFDTRKKLKLSQTGGLEQKLTKRQKRTVALNNALLLLHSNQYEPCRRALNELKSTFGEEEDMVLIEVSLLIRQKEWAKAAEILQNYLSEVSDASNTVSFALAQIYLSEGKISGAVDILNGIGEKKWTPAVLSLLVAIHLGREENGEALRTLVEAVEFYKANEPDSNHLSVLVEQCATLHAKFGDQKAASKYLEDLRKMKPKDPQVLARLIQAYSEFDPKKAESVCRSLPPMVGEGLIKRRKKKKRKSKLPKNMDPNLPPDPERWIPKFERSTFKKKKDRRAKEREIGKGTQGAVAGAGVDLDTTKKVGATQVNASPKPGVSHGGTAPPVAGPRQQRPGGQSKPKKKKKGGSKW